MVRLGEMIDCVEWCFLAGVSLHDVDIFEINEAFASQAVYCVEVQLAQRGLCV